MFWNRVGTLTGIWLVAGFIIWVGTHVMAGEKMKGSRGFMRMGADGINAVSDAVGSYYAGVGIIAIGVFAGIAGTIFLWRDEMF